MTKGWLTIALAAALGIGSALLSGLFVDGIGVDAERGAARLAEAYEKRISGLWVEGRGVVSAVLPDDTRGSRHQRFIVRLDSGQTVLVVHNIDLAPRIENLATADEVVFKGEYEWNEKGGVIHWTHHDPRGYGTGGWIEHNGRVYR